MAGIGAGAEEAHFDNVLGGNRILVDRQAVSISLHSDRNRDVSRLRSWRGRRRAGPDCLLHLLPVADGLSCMRRRNIRRLMPATEHGVARTEETKDIGRVQCRFDAGVAKGCAGAWRRLPRPVLIQVGWRFGHGFADFGLPEHVPRRWRGMFGFHAVPARSRTGHR